MALPQNFKRKKKKHSRLDGRAFVLDPMAGSVVVSIEGPLFEAFNVLEQHGLLVFRRSVLLRKHVQINTQTL